MGLKQGILDFLGLEQGMYIFCLALNRKFMDCLGLEQGI